MKEKCGICETAHASFFCKVCEIPLCERDANDEFDKILCEGCASVYKSEEEENEG